MKKKQKHVSLLTGEQRFEERSNVQVFLSGSSGVFTDMTLKGCNGSVMLVWLLFCRVAVWRKTTHRFRKSSTCGFRKFVRLCVRQCVTSRKLLSADLHNALFPLSRSEKQPFCKTEEKPVKKDARQRPAKYSRATCGYNKSAEVLNKGLSHQTSITICQVSHVRWKNTTQSATVMYAAHEAYSLLHVLSIMP